MTPEDAVSEYRRVIAEYDARYGEDPLEKRQRQREAEKQERRQQEVRKIEKQAVNHRAALRLQTSNDWWQQHDQRVYACIKLWVEQWWELQRCVLIDAVGQVFGEERSNRREAIAKIKERIIQLEATHSLEARFAILANNVKHESTIPRDELLAKFEGLQHQVDELEGVADLDARFRELAGRVGELESTNSLDARFAELANEIKCGSKPPQSELLTRVDRLERQLDDLKKVADLNARFCEFAEHVGELEKTNEARFTKLAEAKGGAEIQQRELHARIEGLQRQIDDLKRVDCQPGPQGPPGPAGKLPRVKEYVAGRVHYESDVVTHAGALWQARGDTVHAPPHPDWVCLAHAGRNGSDGRSPNVCGTYNAHETYKRLDIVALDGAAFIAERDDPGICPGDGWQMLSRQGRPGCRGETGERGIRGEKVDKGEPGTSVVAWQLDRQRYRVSPLMSDGKVGPALELRALFQQYHAEADQCTTPTRLANAPLA